MEPDFSGMTIVEGDGGGLELFIAYAKKFSKRSYKILCIIDDDRMENLLQKRLGADSMDIIRLQDDPLGWDGTSSKTSGLLQNASILFEALQKRVNCNGQKTAIIIPCMSLIWITLGHLESIRFLAMLKSWSGDEAMTNPSILALINGRLLTDSQSDQLKFLSSMWSSVSKSKPEKDSPEMANIRLGIKSIQKKGAKIISKSITVDVTNASDLVTATKSMVKVSKPEISSDQDSDPTAGLTFNLKLKEAEAAAKRGIQLPYLAIRDNMRKNRTDVSPGGQVFYTPDEADDFDDEDPDADLEI